jgi:hypothetical protein
LTKILPADFGWKNLEKLDFQFFPILENMTENWKYFPENRVSNFFQKIGKNFQTKFLEKMEETSK